MTFRYFALIVVQAVAILVGAWAAIVAVSTGLAS